MRVSARDKHSQLGSTVMKMDRVSDTRVMRHERDTCLSTFVSFFLLVFLRNSMIYERISIRFHQFSYYKLH